jgi:hypothetical protein
MGSYLENLLIKTMSLGEQVHPRPVARFEPLPGMRFPPAPPISEQSESEGETHRVAETSSPESEIKPVQPPRPMTESNLEPAPIAIPEIRSSRRRISESQPKSEEPVPGNEMQAITLHEPSLVTVQPNIPSTRGPVHETARPSSQDISRFPDPAPEIEPHIPVIPHRETLIRETVVERSLPPVEDRSEKDQHPTPEVGQPTPKPEPKLKPSDAHPISSVKTITPEIQPYVEPPSIAQPAAEKSPEVPPTVHVTIGRIEVRATPSSTPPSPKKRSPSPVMTLDEYLQSQKNGGEG